MSLLGSVFGAPDPQDIYGAYGAAQGYSNTGAQQRAYNAALQNQLATQGVQAGQANVAQQAFDPNQLEAYQIPLSQLVTLWQAKYGDKWVKDEEFWNGKEPFFSTAADRLKANNLFEKAAGWYRLKEEV